MPASCMQGLHANLAFSDPTTHVQGRPIREPDPDLHPRFAMGSHPPSWPANQSLGRLDLRRVQPDNFQDARPARRRCEAPPGGRRCRAHRATAAHQAGDVRGVASGSHRARAVRGPTANATFAPSTEPGSARGNARRDRRHDAPTGAGCSANARRRSPRVAGRFLRPLGRDGL